MAKSGYPTAKQQSTATAASAELAQEEQAQAVSEVLSGIGPQSSDDSVGLPDHNMAVDDDNALPNMVVDDENALLIQNEMHDFHLNMEVPEPVDMEIVLALPANPVPVHQPMEAALPIHAQQGDEHIVENEQVQQQVHDNQHMQIGFMKHLEPAVIDPGYQAFTFDKMINPVQKPHPDLFRLWAKHFQGSAPSQISASIPHKYMGTFLYSSARNT